MDLIQKTDGKDSGSGEDANVDGEPEKNESLEGGEETEDNEGAPNKDNFKFEFYLLLTDLMTFKHLMYWRDVI